MQIADFREVEVSLLNLRACMSAASIDETVDLERKPNLVRDVCALVLIAFTLILTVSLVTHNAADPLDTPIWPISEFYTPDATIFPPNATITNACGYWGALLSSLLLDALGIASAIVIGALGGVATALILRGNLNAPVLRSLGGTIIVIAVATGGAMLPLQASGLPVVGGGGFLGAMTSTWLLEHFAPAGAWILTLTLFLVGTLMTSDYALLYASKRILKEGHKVSKSGLRRAANALPAPRRRRPFTDLEEPIKIDGDDDVDVESDASGGSEPAERGEPTIKFRQPKKKSSVQEPEAYEDEDVEEEFVEEGYDEDAEDWDEEGDGASESAERELDIRNEKHTVRKDESHNLSQPKVKVPKRKNKAESSENMFEDMNESLPGGMEDYRLPSIELLEQSDDICYEEQLHEVRRKAHVLEETFRDFGFNIRVVEIETGPVIAQYEIELEAGLRLSKITGLADDLAIALRVPSVRIVAPIPGKNTVGIEVPNETRQAVRLRDVIEESDTRSAKMNIPVFLGKDVSGNPMVVDLAKMPHLLIAGRTGTGKSVCLNAIITSVLMCCRPDEVRMLMIDPKMVELSGYGRLPHLMHPVITDMKKAEAILAWAVEKMEERYSLLAKVGVRHINSFNDLGREEIMRRLEIDEADATKDVPEKLPFIVIVADEMADLMMTAGKDVEQHIIRLAQKSRAVGIHLILATQKPTVDVITGLIKSNLPARLSFQVASKTDSRVVLDENGADKLLGNGDMLFLWPGTSTLIRGQGTFLSDDEIDTICDHCSKGEQNFVGELMNLKVEQDGDGADGTSMEQIKKRDELYDSAIEVVIREGRGSCSLLQRCLGIGYGRAAKLIDFMAEDGIVGDYNGSKAREVVMTMAQWQAMQGLDVDEEDDVVASQDGATEEVAAEDHTDEDEDESEYEEDEENGDGQVDSEYSEEDEYEEDEYDEEEYEDCE